MEFGPIYKDAPRFGDIDRHLLEQGFEFHHFSGFGRRRHLAGTAAFGARAVRQLWADAVYVPSFERIDSLEPQRLLKLAAIAHDCYGAQDLANLSLTLFDAVTGESFAKAYREAVLHSGDAA